MWFPCNGKGYVGFARDEPSDSDREQFQL